VYDSLPLVGSTVSRRLLGTAIMCLFAVIAGGCAGDEPTSPDPTQPPTAAPTAQPTVTRPTPAATATTGPTGTEPPVTEPTPTEGGGMSQSPEPAPSVLTDGHDGRVVSLTLGAETSLRLDSAWFWDEPNVQGDAVVLTRVDYLTDPGFMEWIVTAQQPGTAMVTASGEPNCADVSQCPPRSIEFSFHVPE
jgi:hypothetical protein